MNSNNGKVALVTGSTRGIGSLIAEELEKCGFLVVTNSRNQGIKEHAVADVSDPGEVSNLVHLVKEKFGRLDLLVANVGKSNLSSETLSQVDYWNYFLKFNLLSAVYPIEGFLDLLKQSKGSIIVISSICGIRPIDGAPLGYGVAKAALNMYVKGAAVQFAQYGVRINAIAPGNVLFPNSIWDQKLKSNESATLEYIDDNVPLGIFISPDEISRAVTYLALETSAVTGHILRIDGGQTL